MIVNKNGLVNWSKMIKLSRLIVWIFLAFLSTSTYGQSVVEALGYPTDAKLLIVHTDDLGAAHSENQASFDAMENGIASSGSIMVPTPWFTEVYNVAKIKSDLDLGIHLTLTSEWDTYKWGPVSSLDKVRSLVNDQGYFHSSTGAFIENAKIDEVEFELRNQIQKALDNGIDVTHLDAHMGAAFSTPENQEVYMKLGKEFRIPVMLSKTMVSDYPYAVDQIYGAPTESYPDGMIKYYENLMSEINPGLNVLIVHCAYDDDEMQAVTVNHPLYGSLWRQKDFDFLTSTKAKTLINDNNIILVTWKDIRDKLIRK